MVQVKYDSMLVYGLNVNVCNRKTVQLRFSLCSLFNFVMNLVEACSLWTNAAKFLALSIRKSILKKTKVHNGAVSAPHPLYYIKSL